ncbi:NYN domain-containing protein [Stella sp.]|uniref:LabA-like NYN domain-containing protein n=1 Tax=Stella sp. TaxID=2912054 RepID=UPI0035B4F82F
MHFYPEDRIAVFIDGANFYGAARALGFDIDYRRMHELFTKKARLLRIAYYTTFTDDQDYSPLRPLIDWLDYNGFMLVTKPAKEFTDATGRRRFKGSMDVEIAVDMLEVAGRVDHVVLMSGDGDLRAAVEAVQRKGVRVTVVSTLRSQPPMIADELRRQADSFVDLQDLAPLVQRSQAARDEALPARYTAASTQDEA